MAEFKFSCPQCSQHILCDTGYSGAQINCPSCNHAIVVPQAPGSAAAPIAPPPVRSPQAPPGLATRQSTAAPASGKQFSGAPGAPSAPAKSHALRNILVITAAIVALAALGGGGWFFYSKHKAKVAQELVAKGNPAAMVPTPSAAQSSGAMDILTKVQQAYTNLTSLSVAGTAMMVIDMSAITADDLNAGQPDSKKKTTQKKTTRGPAGVPKGMTNTTEVAIKLSRPDLYRVEGKMKMSTGPMTMTNTIAIWSPGKTNYSLMVFGGGSYKNFTTVADRKSAFMMNGQSGVLAMAIPELFFNETGDMDKFIQEWGQTGDETVGGQDCYTLTGKMMGQKLKIWVSKASYMVLQSQVTLGGAVSDADIETAINATASNSKQTQAQLDRQKVMARQQAAMMTKIRGTITETYDTVQPNLTFAIDDFDYPVPRGVRLNAAPTFPGATTSATSSSSSATSTETSWRNACINNLRQIDAAKNQWALENGKKNGDPCTEADIKLYIKLDANGNLPKCPAGGKYTIGKLGEKPTCSIPGHELP